MKCPACERPLTVIQVGTLQVDACVEGCGGIWFDAFELKRVDDANDVVGEPLLHIRRGETISVDPSRKRDCPRCPDLKLKRHLFSPKSGVVVDECPGCGGYWLDDGELAKIREERAWLAEQAAQGDVSTDLIRYLYEVRTGHQKHRPI